ncbi:unnamed protein product, partial [Prorocentrum cordatum]
MPSSGSRTRSKRLLERQQKQQQQDLSRVKPTPGNLEKRIQGQLDRLNTKHSEHDSKPKQLSTLQQQLEQLRRDLALAGAAAYSLDSWPKKTDLVDAYRIEGEPQSKLVVVQFA